MTADTQHPGVFLLKRYLRPLGVTPCDLALALGLEQQQVTKLIEGRSSITPDTAARLALYFDVPSAAPLREQPHDSGPSWFRYSSS